MHEDCRSACTTALPSYYSAEACKPEQGRAALHPASPIQTLKIYWTQVRVRSREIHIL